MTLSGFGSVFVKFVDRIVLPTGEVCLMDSKSVTLSGFGNVFAEFPDGAVFHTFLDELYQ